MSTQQRSTPVLLALSWLLVILPTLWGLSYTVRNAMKLFQPQPAATAPATATPTPTTPASNTR